MTIEHIETLVVGAGQAGLSTAYHLQRQGREVLVVDGADRVGDSWRHQWDTLRLYTPARYDGLPGLPFPAPSWHFPSKDEVADYLEAYALRWDLPVRLNTRVDRLRPRSGDGFLASIGPDTISCDNVVVATGTFGRTPNVPLFATELDPSLTQMHSSEYRRPDQLRPGRVLVVGAAHSGTDIAYEVAQTRPTVLSGRSCGELPFSVEAVPARFALPLLMFAFSHVLTRRTPIGRKQMDDIRFHGGLNLRVRESDLAAREVERVTARVSGAEHGRPLLDDGQVLDVANVIWCTGFRQDFDWIEVPVFGDGGWPVEYRGVVENQAGLYVCGLSFQFAFTSMLLPGVGRDAAHVASHIVARAGSARTPVPA